MTAAAVPLAWVSWLRVVAVLGVVMIHTVGATASGPGSTTTVDGWVARRTGTASVQGSRLDMETDAALMLVLCVPLAFTLGPWVLAIGVMRYAFVALSWWRPALRGHLEFSQFRRVVAAIQAVVLVVALVPLVPEPAAQVVDFPVLAHRLDGAPDQQDQLVGVDRLRQVVVRPGAHRLDGGRDTAVPR